jgi:hypothetical protein
MSTSMKSAAWARLVGCLGVSAVLIAAFVSTGSSARDVVIWIAVVTAGILLPGVVVVRGARRKPVSVGDDLAWSVPVGIAVALVGWAVAQVIPIPGWLWGLLVTAVVLAHPLTRRRASARPRGQWGPWMTLSVGAVMAITIAWMTRQYLQWTPVDPGPHGHVYYVDSTYQGTLLAELSRHGLPQYPMVAGEPLSYHWFLYAVLSRLGAGTNLDRLDVMLRLAPVSLMLGALLLVASVARQLAGRTAAGPLAAGLVGVVGSFTPTTWTASGIGPSMVNTSWWSAPTTTLGWITGIAVLGSGIALVRQSRSDRSAAPVLLLPILIILTSGSKSSQLPVLVCGFALAAVVMLLCHDRRQAVRAATVTFLIATVMAIATVTVYRGQSYGLRFAPGRSIVPIAFGVFPGLAHNSPAASYLLQGHLPRKALLAAAFLWLIPQLLRCAGIAWLVRGRHRDPATWVTLGAGISALVAFAVLRHPGGSEVYFPIAAYPIVAIGAGCGLASVLPHGVQLRRWLTVGTGLVLGGAGIAAVVAVSAGRTSPLVRWKAALGRPPGAGDVSISEQVWQWSWPYVAALGATGACMVVAWLVWRRLRVAALVGLAVTMGVGCFTTATMLTGQAQPSFPEVLAADKSGRPPALTRDLVAAGNWLAHHAKSTDVVAVNRACLPIAGQKDPRICASQDFTITWATGLRSDVEGWAYTGRNVQSAWTNPSLAYSRLPFWDQRRLNAELAAFVTPSRASYEALYASGVRWLLADRPTTALHLARMDSLADRELTLGTVTVWRLRAPS